MKKRNLFLHLGLAKTATTSLQKLVFSSSDYCYLGKFVSSDEHEVQRTDPYFFLKFLQNDQPGIPLRKMRLNHELILHMKVVLAAASGSQDLFISDEGFTIQPLLVHMDWLVRVLAKIQSSRGIDAVLLPEESFADGVELAKFCSHSKHSLADDYRRILFGPGSDPISFKIGRFLELFNAEPGRMLIVDRDFGSWFVSMFLQFTKINDYKFTLSDCSSSIIFALAGFALHWDYCLRERGKCGYVCSSSFVNTIESAYGEGLVDVLSYSSNPHIFSERVGAILPNYGLVHSASAALARAARANASFATQFDSSLAAEIFASRSQYQSKLNELTDCYLKNWPA